MIGRTAQDIRLAPRADSLKPSSTLGVNARVRELKAQGKDVVAFGAGEPDFATPRAICDAAVKALGDGLTHYQPVPGTPEARKAIADKLQRDNGIDCAPGDIVITAGAKHAVYLALQALIDPDSRDEVIIPTPAWVSYQPMIELSGGRAVEVPTALENDFRLSPRQLADAITDRTAALIINSPSNPCGTMYGPDDLAELAAVLADFPHVAVISDEIYERLVYGPEPHRSFATLDGMADRTITVNGLSKSHAMTGWRIGYICAPMMDGALAAAVARMQGQMNSHIAAFAYPAIVTALNECDDEVERMRQCFARRGELMHRLVCEMPKIDCPVPVGAFYLFPRIASTFGKTAPGGRLIESAQDFAEALLDDALVAVVPGEDFGAGAENHVRLSFACGEDDITRGCQRIRDWLDALR